MSHTLWLIEVFFLNYLLLINGLTTQKCRDPRAALNIGILGVQWFLGVKSKSNIPRQSERSERLEVEGPKDLNILTSLSITDDMESWLVCKLVSVLMTYAIFTNGIWILMDITVAIFLSKAHRIRKIVCNQFSSL